MTSLRTLFTRDHEDFRASVRQFVEREVVPNQAKWEEQRLVDRDTWRAAGRQGLVGLGVDERYGGGGTDDFRFRTIIAEELYRVGSASFALCLGLQDDIVLPYLLDLGTAEQKQQWLPGSCTGELIGAIAMTEPSTGSDLQRIQTIAVRDGSDWVLSGAKTFISSGIAADYTVVFARTGEKETSLFLVDAALPGYVRGRKLDKLGLHGQDTAELFFDDIRLPADAVLGEAGGGFAHLMDRLPRERLSIAVGGVSAARAAIEWTLAYTKDRSAFGAPLANLQTVQFTLAELQTEVDVTQAYVDAAVLALNEGRLSAVDAAKAKWWATDVQKRVLDRCLQLFGGYGYMLEYPIARAFLDARVQSIYGGANEIMKLIIGRDLVSS